MYIVEVTEFTLVYVFCNLFCSYGRLPKEAGCVFDVPASKRFFFSYLQYTSLLSWMMV